MSNSVKRNSVLAIVLFVLYLCQNIVRNILVNMFVINDFIATVVTVIFFSAITLLITKKDNILKTGNKDQFYIKYIVVVILVLGIINMFPFDASVNLSVISVIVSMLFVGLMEELIFRGYVYKIFIKSKVSICVSLLMRL